MAQKPLKTPKNPHFWPFLPLCIGFITCFRPFSGNCRFQIFEKCKKSKINTLTYPFSKKHKKIKKIKKTQKFTKKLKIGKNDKIHKFEFVISISLFFWCFIVTQNPEKSSFLASKSMKNLKKPKNRPPDLEICSGWPQIPHFDLKSPKSDISEPFLFDLPESSIQHSRIAQDFFFKAFKWSPKWYKTSKKPENHENRPQKHQKSLNS